MANWEVAAASPGWELARDTLAPVSALLGILVGGVIGWLVGRGRERREMRRAAYVEWLRAAQSLPRLPDARSRLDEATAEVQLVGSERVLGAVHDYIDRVSGADDVIAAAKDLFGAVRAFQDFTSE